MLLIAVVAIYLLHQDFWFWRSARPIIFGFLPIGLFYHVCYTLAVSALMWALVKYAWPSRLEESAGDGESGGSVEKDSPIPPLSRSPALSLSDSRMEDRDK
jgi:hypothetical protein